VRLSPRGERGTDREAPGSGRRHALLWAACRDAPVLALTLGFLAVSSWLTFGPATSWQTTFYWFLQVPSDILLFLSARYLFRQTQGVDRRFWRLVSVAGATFCAGDVIRTVEGLVGLENRDPGPAQTAGFVIGQCAFVAALIGYRVLTESRAAQRRFVLDATIVVFGSAAAIWYLLTGPKAVSASSVGLVGGLLLAAEVLMVGFLAVKLVLSGQAPTTPAASASVILAGITQVSNSTVIAIHATPLRYGLSLSVQLLPGILLALGPRLQVLETRLPPVARRVHRSRPYSPLPYVAVGVVYLLLLAALVDGRILLDLRSWGMVAAMGLVTALVVWRQLLSATENARLITELDRSLLELHEQKERFSSLVAHSSDITIVIDRNGVISYASPAAERVLGLRPDQLVGSTFADHVHPEDIERLGAEWLEMVAVPGRAITTQGRLKSADRGWRWVEVVNTNLLHDPTVAGVVCNARDITDARELQNQLIHQASHDVLTKLPNRRLFARRLASAADSDGSRAALLMIDLDGFKPINDTYGHHVGDAVLVAVAERIRRCVRPTDTAARLGGDEFAVLMPGANLEQASRLAERFKAALSEPVAIGSLRLVIGASIGITVGDMTDPESLQRQADAEMYAAKRRGRGEPAPQLAPVASA
jgi:diguanylate cyclase (GGDEF)-like protein/PAS domain S-box-containing protein